MNNMSRRTFLQQTACLSAGLLGGASLVNAKAPTPPNVILIYSDDHGSIDLNCYGATDLYTPNLDALASRGIRFKQMYAASAVCSPSRAALLTGRYPHRAGVPGNAESHPRDFGLGNSLGAEEVTIAEMLQDAGYRTGLFGKWHLGTQPGPNGCGFEEAYGFLGGCIDKFSHFNYGGGSWGSPPQWHDLYHNGEQIWQSGTHCGDLIVRETNRFIDTHKEEPFFAYVAFGTPHYPMQPYDKYMEQYADMPEPRRAYAALVSTLDEQVGNIIDHLDASGLRENTIVIFQGDQGHSTEARANYGGGNSGGLRGAKQCLFEAGLRVPAIVSWPGTLPEGETRDAFCTNCDWLPTLAAWCGATVPNTKIDGKALQPILAANDAPTQHAYWHWQFKEQWAVREGDWKLLDKINDTTDGRNKRAIPGPLLYNLVEDPGEQHNLIKVHPKIAEKLAQYHIDWERELGES